MARHGAPPRDASAPEQPPAPHPIAPQPPPGPGLLDGLEEGVVVCDRAGVVRAANTAR